MKRSIPFRQIELEQLKDPECAREYLQISLEETSKDKNQDAFLRALQNVIDARGGISGLAERINLPIHSIEKTLSQEGNAYLQILDSILSNLGLHLVAEGKELNPESDFTAHIPKE